MGYAAEMYRCIACHLSRHITLLCDEEKGNRKTSNVCKMEEKVCILK